MSVGLRKRLDELISTKICAVVKVVAGRLWLPPFYVVVWLILWEANMTRGVMLQYFVKFRRAWFFILHPFSIFDLNNEKECQVRCLREIIWPRWQKWESGQVTMENYLTYTGKIRFRSRTCEESPDLDSKIENQVRWLREITWPARQKWECGQKNELINRNWSD